MRIGLVQLGSWGDNINSTLMFKPLKAAYPDATLHVHTASNYAAAFANNPFITELIQYPANSKVSALNHYNTVPALAKKLNYDILLVPHPMLHADKWRSIQHPEFGDNLICAWIRAIEDLGVPYELPFETILRLTTQEVDRVNEYCSHIDMNGTRNVLMEVHGESGQTDFNPQWMDRAVRHLTRGDTNVFISRASDGPDIKVLQHHAPGRVHFVGKLSIRECVALFNKCHVFLSVSSGLANACNTSAAKTDIQWVEAVNSPACSTKIIRSSNRSYYYTNDLNGYIRLLEDNGI